MKNSIYIVTPFIGNINNAASRRVNSFVDSLINTGYEITVIYSNSGNIDSEIQKKPTLFKLEGNRSKLIYRAMFEIIWGCEVLLRILLLKRKSIIIASSPPYLSFLIYGLASVIGKKMIFDVRDIYPQMYYHTGLMSKNGFFYKVLEKYTNLIYHRAIHLITVTDSLRLKILPISYYKEITVIRNGYSEKIRSLRKKRKVEKEFRIVFHGTIGSAQNIELLLEIIDKFKEDKTVKFMIIGDGPKANEILKSMGNVEYYRDLPFHQMFSIISDCHLGISFRNEGFIGESALPVKVLEYIGLGLPVISTPKNGELSTLRDEGYFIKLCNNVSSEIIPEIEMIRTNYNQMEFDLGFSLPELSREKENLKLIKLLDEIY